MLSEAKILELKKLRGYCDALIRAQEVLAEQAPEDQPKAPAELAAWKLSQSNLILAGSGEKAEILGTISTEPVVTAEDLTSLDVCPSMADELVAAAADIRTQALALREPVAASGEMGK